MRISHGPAVAEHIPHPTGATFQRFPLVQRLVRFVLATVGRMLALGEKPELGHRLKTYQRVKDTKFDLKKILEETRLTAIQYTLLKWHKLQLPNSHKTDFFCRFCRAELSHWSSFCTCHTREPMTLLKSVAVSVYKSPQILYFCKLSEQTGPEIPASWQFVSEFLEPEKSWFSSFNISSCSSVPVSGYSC